MEKIALSILAHPDDAEFLCAGTLARLARECSWQIHIATMTAGDCGSAELPPEEISAIRSEEGRRAAACIGASYHCLEERDLRIFYNEPTLEKLVLLLRQIRPTIIFTHSPSDYMLDHEMTSTLVRAASFNAPIPNFCRGNGHPPALPHIPHLYYCDPIEGKNIFGEAVRPGFLVDITASMEIKGEMLACHASQREWLRKHHGMDQYIEAMRTWSAHRGAEAGTAFAEGFRQHLGHSYPQENLLSELLGTISVS